MSEITGVIAREILDSRGNPTVEVEVQTESGSRPRRRPVGRIDRRARGTRAARRRRQALPRQGRHQGSAATSRRCSVRPSSAWTRSIRAQSTGCSPGRRHADQVEARRQRASSACRWPSRAPRPTRSSCRSGATSAARTARIAADAAHEHPERRRARRQRPRDPGVHDRAARRAELRRSAARGRRGLPRAQGEPQEGRPRDVGRRRRRLRAARRLNRRGHPAHHRVDRSGRLQARAPTSRSRSTPPPASSTTRRPQTLHLGQEAAHPRGAGRHLRRRSARSTRSSPSRTASPRTTGRAGSCSPTSSASACSSSATTSSSPTRCASRAGIDEGIANAILIKLNQIGTVTETLDTHPRRDRRRLPLDHLAPLGRDRGHLHRRPRGRAPTRGRSRPAACRAAIASPSTTSCSASRRCSARARSTRARRPSRGRRRDACRSALRGSAPLESREISAPAHARPRVSAAPKSASRPSLVEKQPAEGEAATGVSWAMIPGHRRAHVTERVGHEQLRDHREQPDPDAALTHSRWRGADPDATVGSAGDERRRRGRRRRRFPRSRRSCAPRGWSPPPPPKASPNRCPTDCHRPEPERSWRRRALMTSPTPDRGDASAPSVAGATSSPRKAQRTRP